MTEDERPVLRLDADEVDMIFQLLASLPSRDVIVQDRWWRRNKKKTAELRALLQKISGVVPREKGAKYDLTLERRRKDT